MSNPADADIRHDWQRHEVEALFALPFHDLVYRAQGIHRRYFDPAEIQASTLLSIKTGGCPEDCKYCPQSIRYHTGLEPEALMDRDKVLEAARRAREAGASRFCMGAAWRNPKESQVDAVADLVAGVRSLGLETCATLGMLKPHQAERLSEAGLDYYNHNIDTSPEYYDEVVTTRSFQERLDTLEAVREAGIKVCCGGIIGMGETVADRAAMLTVLATLDTHPESVPINRLVQVPGTPFHGMEQVDPFEFVRTIAVARIIMPQSWVRLSAGRDEMNDELQALCFLAGANSIFYGDQLLTTDNPEVQHDQALLARLGMYFQTREETAQAPA
jgi:biotin synthase